MAAGVLVDARVRLDIGRDRDRGVIHEALADAGQGRAHLDPQVLQVPDRADAGAQQVGRRVDGAAREDHLARPELLARALDVRHHADAAPALEQQLGHLRVGRDRQVGALARGRIEVADGRRHAPLVGVGDGDRVVAVAPFAVLVGQVLEARGLEGLGRGLGMARPQLREDAPHGDAPLLAVQGAFEVHVALDLLVEGQHVRPAPAARAARHPLLEVGRRAAVGELAVDGGAAAQDARLLVLAQRRRALLRVVVRDHLGAHLELGPVEARVEVGGAGVAVEHLGRHLAVRGVLAGLEQQHLVRALGGQAVGQHRPRRAAADDDEVVGCHGSPLLLAVASLRVGRPRVNAKCFT